MKNRDLTSFSFIDNSPRYSVKFFLLEERRIKSATGELPLYCRVIIHRKKSDFSLNFRVKPEDWDYTHGKFHANKKHLNYLNLKLSEVEGRIDEICSSLNKENKKITAAIIKDRFKGKTTDLTKVDLIAFLDLFISEIRQKTQEYKPGSVQHYVALKTHLQQFLKVNNLDGIELQEVTRNFLDRFETYLLSTPHKTLGRAMNKNTCNRYLVKLSVLFKNAIRKELITKNPFDGFKISREKGSKVYLTKEEITLIKNHWLGDNEALKKVRDIFFFSIYTGLRFSDAVGLKDSSVKKDEKGELWIYGNQVKTKDRIDIPMLNQAKEIYDKYEDNRKKTGWVLPRMYNQKINLHLKEIANLVGIDKKLTHHVARHTFATLALENGVPIHLVSKYLGHASLKTTSIYTHISRKELSKVSDKLNKALS